MLFYGMLLPTLEAILKKIRDIKADISTMTTGLSYSVENSIINCFRNILNS